MIGKIDELEEAKDEEWKERNYEIVNNLKFAGVETKLISITAGLAVGEVEKIK